MSARGLRSLEDGPVYGEVELDLFAGWAGNITDGVGADVGVTLLCLSHRRTPVPVRPTCGSSTASSSRRSARSD